MFHKIKTQVNSNLNIFSAYKAIIWSYLYFNFVKCIPWILIYLSFTENVSPRTFTIIFESYLLLQALKGFFQS